MGDQVIALEDNHGSIRRDIPALQTEERFINKTVVLLETAKRWLELKLEKCNDLQPTTDGESVAGTTVDKMYLPDGKEFVLKAQAFERAGQMLQTPMLTAIASGPSPEQIVDCNQSAGSSLLPAPAPPLPSASECLDVKSESYTGRVGAEPDVVAATSGDQMALWAQPSKQSATHGWCAPVHASAVTSVLCCQINSR